MTEQFNNNVYSHENTISLSLISRTSKLLFIKYLTIKMVNKINVYHNKYDISYYMRERARDLGINTKRKKKQFGIVFDEEFFRFNI